MTIDNSPVKRIKRMTVFVSQVRETRINCFTPPQSLNH